MVLPEEDVGRALSYAPDLLLSFKGPYLNTLDFTGYPEKHGFAIIDKLFPKNAKYGKLDPPPHYLTSGQRIRDWRKISRSNQQHIIDNPPRPNPVTRGSSLRGTRRRKRQRQSVEEPNQNDLEQSQLNQLASNTIQSPLPDRGVNNSVADGTLNEDIGSGSSPHASPATELEEEFWELERAEAMGRERLMHQIVA